MELIAAHLIEWIAERLFPNAWWIVLLPMVLVIIIRLIRWRTVNRQSTPSDNSGKESEQKPTEPWAEIRNKIPPSLLTNHIAACIIFTIPVIVIGFLVFSALYSLHHSGRELLRIDNSISSLMMFIVIWPPIAFLYARARLYASNSRCAICGNAVDPRYVYDDGSQLYRCTSCTRKELLCYEALAVVLVGIALLAARSMLTMAVALDGIGVLLILLFSMPELIAASFVWRMIKHKEQWLREREHIRRAESHVTVRTTKPHR